MRDAQDKDHELVVVEVVDDPVVADTDPHLAVAADQHDGPFRAGVCGKFLDSLLDAFGIPRMDTAERLGRSAAVCDLVGQAWGLTASEPEFGHQLLVGDAGLGLRASLPCCVGVGLVLERFERAVEELRRDDDGAATRSARGDLDWFALRLCDEVALTRAELGKGDGGHTPIVQLVQDDHNVHMVSERAGRGASRPAGRSGASRVQFRRRCALRAEESRQIAPKKVHFSEGSVAAGQADSAAGASAAMSALMPYSVSSAAANSSPRP